MIGNKAEVGTEEGQQFARDHGLLFLETSAKTNTNVEEVFSATTEAIHIKILNEKGDLPGELSDIQLGLVRLQTTKP